jgi:hypothetical protein
VPERRCKLVLTTILKSILPANIVERLTQTKGGYKSSLFCGSNTPSAGMGNANDELLSNAKQQSQVPHSIREVLAIPVDLFLLSDSE